MISFLALQTEKVKNSNVSTKIVGGRSASIKECPYQVSILVNNEAYCGGSIISQNWIITAGHCVYEYPKRYVTIRSGSDYTNVGGFITKIIKTIRHPGYKTNSQGIPTNDIALASVQRPFIFGPTCRAITLLNSGETVSIGSRGIVTGWGAKKEDGPNSSIVQLVYVPVISKHRCNMAYKSFGGISKGQFCAGLDNGGKDACQGDSGGPFVVNGRLSGIISWGNGCGRKGYPGVYTEIAFYRDWIRSKVNV